MVLLVPLLPIGIQPPINGGLIGLQFGHPPTFDGNLWGKILLFYFYVFAHGFAVGPPRGRDPGETPSLRLPLLDLLNLQHRQHLSTESSSRWGVKPPIEYPRRVQTAAILNGQSGEN